MYGLSEPLAAVRSDRQLFTTSVAISHALAVTPDTVCRWRKQGHFPHAIQVQDPHYSDTKPRKTRRGYWLIPVSDVRAWLRSAPKAALRSLERRAAELSPDARIVQGPGAQPLPLETPKPVSYQKIQARALR